MQGNRPLVILLALLAFLGVLYTVRVSDHPERQTGAGLPSRVVLVNGYPEFQVDNKPFFVHSAAFYYYRIPRDRWEESLRGLKQHGINTIDLYVVWNWHQPTEDNLDLDGRTNPQRDLAGLLALISEMNFKLSVRPGPFICSEWKNGGYPDWLLVRPEYQMPLKDILEGRYPRQSALQYEFSEEAADLYLKNSTHLRYMRKWYGDVMEVVRPRLASRGGNVIMLQVDDDQALDRYNYNGPRFWEYMNLMRRYLLEAAGDPTIPVYFNPADMRVTGASSTPAAESAFWAMGQYYQEEGFGSDVLRAEDAIQAKYLTEILKTQPGFPPFFIEYQAGWYSGAEDIRARGTDPTNSLLSSRFLFQNGVKGLNYFPLHDTLFPSGYECPWSNYFYSWESAIGLEGDLRPRAEASIRNGRLIQGMGSLLAASHYVADIGIVHTIGTYPQERLTREDIRDVVFRTHTALQIAQFNQIAADLVDLDYHTVFHLNRYPLILLPVVSGTNHKKGKAPEYLRFSTRAQSVLREYVRQGGTVVAYPLPPTGELLGDLFPVRDHTRLNPVGETTDLQFAGGVVAAPGSIFLFPSASKGSGIEPSAHIADKPEQIAGYRRRYGKGSAMVFGAEFDRWVPLRTMTSQLDTELPAQPALTDEQRIGTGRILEALLQTAQASRVAEASKLVRGLPAQQPYLSMLAANSSSETGTGSAYGFLSITNFGTAPFTLEPVVRDPRTGTRMQLPGLEISWRDALMLPLRVGFDQFGLPDSEDELVYSTSEVTSVRQEENHVLLEIYSKGRSSIRLRLQQPPSGQVEVDGARVEGRYDAANRTFDLQLPAPRDAGGRQSLRLPYPNARGSAGSTGRTTLSRVNITPTLRIPVRSDVGYDLYPATQTARSDQTVGFSFVHPPDCKGKCTARVTAGDLVVSQVRAEENPAFTLRAPAERTYIRSFDWVIENQGATHSGSGQVVFFAPGEPFILERDVDRDGFNEFVLENEKIRLIVFPRAGARSFVFARKDTGQSAFTSIGGMRDLFRVQMPDPPGQERLPAWTRQGIPGMHNRPYDARVVRVSGPAVELDLSYDAPDVSPKGAHLARTIRLEGNADYFDVRYTVTPREPGADQGYINLNSLAVGSMEDPGATVLRSDRGPEIPLRPRSPGTLEGANWIALASKDGKDFVGMSWSQGSFQSVSYDRREFSVLLQLISPPWKPEEKVLSYSVRYLYAPDTPQSRQALSRGLP